MAVLHKGASFVNEDKMTDDESVDYTESEPESESESEEEDEEVKLSEPSKKAIYNRNGMVERLQDISWPENVDWVHKLTVNVDQEQEVDVNDDLTRELAFYTQALDGTRDAFGKLEAMGHPFLRPPDYYAEMVKTDNHMEKIKVRLLAEKKRIEEAEERRKSREAKKISKEVQAQKNKERSKQKKDEIESVKKWRKTRQQSGYKEDAEEMRLPFEDGKGFERAQKKRPGVRPGDRSGGMGGRQKFNKGKPGMGKKGGRDHRDSKFGFGGKKGLKKQNSADTTNDLKGFNKGEFSANKKRKRA